MSTISFSNVRRKDRAIQDEGWICAMLHAAPDGVLAVIDQDEPYLQTNLFAFDERGGVIYLHTARLGRLRSSADAGAAAGFTVSQMGRLLPADTALEMSVEYASVVISGQLEVVDDPDEAWRGMQLLLDKYFAHLASGVDYRPIQAEEMARTAVYRLRIREWSGKRKQVAADFPGAFEYTGRLREVAFSPLERRDALLTGAE